MARLGGFPQNRVFDSEGLYESAAGASRSGTVRTSLPAGPERDAVINELLDALRERADDLPALIDELRGLMAGRDLTQLVNSVVVPAMTVAFTGADSLADGELTSTWAAKLEYLVGLALSLDPAGDADTPHKVTQRVMQLISDIFEADQARMITTFIAKADADDGNRELLLQQLKLEYQADRMPGYAIHLEEVDAEVFGRHRDYYVTTVGFDPADVIRATRLHTRSVNQAFSAALDAVATGLEGNVPNPEAGVAMVEALNAVTLWDPSAVAASTGIAGEQITAMLDFFSTAYGCQPEFRAPGDPNRARTHPCIKLDDGTFFVPDAWSLSAVIHQRLAVEPKHNGFDPQKYYKHRQDAHERLVAGAFKKVFGAPNVYSTQHYALASGDRGEIDSLVCAEWPVVVEAKAIALTDSGRRGAPARVDKKIDEILGKALDQTDRALTYILNEGGQSFAPTMNGRPVEILPSEVAGGTAVIVTFERIDPFASGGLTVAGSVKHPTWVVSLTDMLLVADILADPAAFHHYARTRAGMHAAGASAASESDALGAYLLDRLSILRDAPAEEATSILIADSSDALNDFYTRQESGLEAHKPSTGVSDEVITALANTLERAGWAKCADAVMSARPSVWPKWKRFRRRHRLGGTFTLNDQVSLVTVSKEDSSLEQVDDSTSLKIPARR